MDHRTQKRPFRAVGGQDETGPELGRGKFKLPKGQ